MLSNWDLKPAIQSHNVFVLWKCRIIESTLGAVLKIVLQTFSRSYVCFLLELRVRQWSVASTMRQLINNDSSKVLWHFQAIAQIVLTFSLKWEFTVKIREAFFYMCEAQVEPKKIKLSICHSFSSCLLNFILFRLKIEK